MSSGASGSLFPSLNTMQQTLLWSLCLCPCLRSRWQKKKATVTSIFTLVEPEHQTESCERGSELQSPSLLFIPSHLYSGKETDATWHVPAAPVFSPVWREPWKLLAQWNINLFYHPLWPKSVRIAILESPDFVKMQIEPPLNVPKLLTFQRAMVHGQTIKYKKILQNVVHIWS